MFKILNVRLIKETNSNKNSILTSHNKVKEETKGKQEVQGRACSKRDLSHHVHFG
jgi:hypothetical protein